MHSSSNKLTLLVTVFPLLIGLILTGIGISDLNTASETHEQKPTNSYGALAFSSIQCDVSGAGLILQDINLKDDVTNIKIDTNLFLEPPSDTPYEVTFGFQLPGISDQPSFTINGFDKGTGEIFAEFTVLEEKLVAYNEEGSSLIYVRFMAQPNFKYYQIVATSNLKGLVSKQSFSTYGVSIPISTTESYLVTNSGFGVTSFKVNWVCMMYAPQGTELKWAIPYPDSQEGWLPFKEDGTPTSESYVSYIWNARDLGFNADSGDVRSNIIRVLLESGSESRLQGRMFFDSGLFMGIGIGLVISGLHELLKALTKMKNGSDFHA